MKTISFGASRGLHRFKSDICVCFALAAFLGYSSARAADEYWRTDGTSGPWTGSNWSTGAPNTGGTSWTSGNNAIFTDTAHTSTVTFATTAVGNVTVASGATVTVTQGGTLTLNPLISAWDVESGGLLTW